MSIAIEKRLQGTVLRIRGDHPFFGTLALFVELRVSEGVETAGTNGRVIWFNPTFADKLSATQLCGLVVHELLHAALLHVPRRRERDPLLWNIAADIVVNGMIRHDTGYDLPRGAVENAALANLSVEEIYEQLQTGKQPTPALGLVDLMPMSSDDGSDDGSDGSDTADRHKDGAGGDGEGGGLGDSMSSARIEELKRHWRTALQQASAVATRMKKGFGHRGLGGMREIEYASESILSWKELLWSFTVSTPYDFQGFDRRFVHRGLYLEEIAGETLDVAIAIDTSGSIGSPELAMFFSEMQGILDAYPQIRGTLFYADAALYGPYEFSKDAPIPPPKGGGGTSFCPFFAWVSEQEAGGKYPVCIYFTDGYGSFPSKPPDSPVLWVVIPGGLVSTEFPFGITTRIG